MTDVYLSGKMPRQEGGGGVVIGISLSREMIELCQVRHQIAEHNPCLKIK